MFCTNCGKEIADSSKFCIECGKPITNTESENSSNEKQEEIMPHTTQNKRNRLVKSLPEIDADEILMLSPLVEDMSDQQASLFAQAYRSRRKENLWIFLVLSLIGIGGVHRFVLGQIGFGLLYLFTFNLCFIGLVIDIVLQKSLVQKYNSSEALKASRIIKATIE